VRAIAGRVTGHGLAAARNRYGAQGVLTIND